MSLLEQLCNYCIKCYTPSNKCHTCTHPLDNCSHVKDLQNLSTCMNCLDEINYHNPLGRSDYNCKNLLLYYTCRYSTKYCSEIIHAIKSIKSMLKKCSEFKILSIGCGNAPDLMAFEHEFSLKKLMYRGYDINPSWREIHYQILKYFGDTDADIQFRAEDAFISFEHPVVDKFNILIIEYFLSHFLDISNLDKIRKLYKDLINNVICPQLISGPFFVIINDISTDNIILYMNEFYSLLKKQNIHVSYIKCQHFGKHCDNDRSVLAESNKNFYSIDSGVRDFFACPIKCSSTQLIMQLESR